MSISEKSFAEHSKWMAFQRNRFSWPKHWQRVIYKIKKEFDVLQHKDRYFVLPSNPDYQTYLNEMEPRPTSLPWDPAPPQHLGVVEFDTMEDIDMWARVASRIS